MKISPIFYMGNKKKLINKGLIDLFPNYIDTFYDLFGGSGIVSMNVKANKYVINDIDENVYNFYNLFKKEDCEVIIKEIISNVKSFGLERVGIKQNTEHSKEYKEKYVLLRNKANSTKNIIDLYSCMFYAFSQQMRFNKKGDFNMPFGNGAFTETNELYIKDGCDFFNSERVNVYNTSFDKLNIELLNTNDFIYLDPPYFNTTATYNENGGWNEEDEDRLYSFCEKLSNSNIKFAMSNVFNNKNIENTKLINWVKNNNFNVYTFDKFTYMACGKGNSNAQEVLITNY